MRRPSARSRKVIAVPPHRQDPTHCLGFRINAWDDLTRRSTRSLCRPETGTAQRFVSLPPGLYCRDARETLRPHKRRFDAGSAGPTLTTQMHCWSWRTCASPPDHDAQAEELLKKYVEGEQRPSPRLLQASHGGSEACMTRRVHRAHI